MLPNVKNGDITQGIVQKVVKVFPPMEIMVICMSKYNIWKCQSIT
jgi:hypothetical protein